jgi:hypothetical protein
MVKWGLSLGLGSVLLACTPTFDDQTAVVTSPRLLAVQATPAEGLLGASFTLTALYVDQNGPRDPSGIDWATCLLQKPLGEPGPINEGCFVDAPASPSTPAPAGLVPLGTGGVVTGTIPQNACQLFGPDSPPPQPGQPGSRPTDPDTTGGFYLPIRVNSGPAQWSVALERIECQPSGVTQPVFLAFTTGYQANANPTVSALSRVGDDGQVTALAPDVPDAADAGTPAPAVAIAPGARVALRVDWPACTGSDPCGGAESYLSIDPISKQVATRRESMVASWYATAGAFDTDRSGRDETDPATNATNTWTAPTASGPVRLWVVLRDARGGVGWGSFRAAVQP